MPKRKVSAKGTLASGDMQVRSKSVSLAFHYVSCDGARGRSLSVTTGHRTIELS